MNKLLKAIFLFWLIVWGVDTVTTIIGVQFMGAREMNPLGYPLGLVFTFGVWLFMFLFTEKLLPIAMRRFHFIYYVWIFVVSTIMFDELINGVIHNLILLW